MFTDRTLPILKARARLPAHSSTCSYFENESAKPVILFSGTIEAGSLTGSENDVVTQKIWIRNLGSEKMSVRSFQLASHVP